MCVFSHVCVYMYAIGLMCQSLLSTLFEAGSLLVATAYTRPSVSQVSSDSSDSAPPPFAGCMLIIQICTYFASGVSTASFMFVWQIVYPLSPKNLSQNLLIIKYILVTTTKAYMVLSPKITRA